MLSEQEIRARFPICMLKLDDEQLRIVERFAQLKSYKDGETLVAVGTRDPNYHVIRSGEVEIVYFPAESGNLFSRPLRGSLWETSHTYPGEPRWSARWLRKAMWRYSSSHRKTSGA